MKKAIQYTCGSGDGMFENKKGCYVETSEYNKLLEYKEKLFDIAYINCKGLSHDELMELTEKYE